MKEIKRRLRLQIELQVDSEGDAYVEFKRYEGNEQQGELIREKFVQKETVSKLVKVIDAGEFDKALEAYIKIYTRR